MASRFLFAALLVASITCGYAHRDEDDAHRDEDDDDDLGRPRPAQKVASRASPKDVEPEDDVEVVDEDGVDGPSETDEDFPDEDEDLPDGKPLDVNEHLEDITDGEVRPDEDPIDEDEDRLALDEDILPDGVDPEILPRDQDILPDKDELSDLNEETSYEEQVLATRKSYGDEQVLDEQFLDANEQVLDGPSSPALDGISMCCLCVQGPDEPVQLVSYSVSGSCSLCKSGVVKKEQAPLPSGCIKGHSDKNYRSVSKDECKDICVEWSR